VLFWTGLGNNRVEPCRTTLNRAHTAHYPPLPVIARSASPLVRRGNLQARLPERRGRSVSLLADLLSHSEECGSDKSVLLSEVQEKVSSQPN